MKKIFIPFVAIALSLAVSALTNFDAIADEEATEKVGYKTMTIFVGHEYQIRCGVWYPAEGGETNVVYDFGTVKIEGRAILNAKPKDNPKRYPIIICSHGYSGCPQSSKYLTEFLAGLGFIVIAPNHTDDLKACSLEDGFVRESRFIYKLIKNGLRLRREFTRGSYNPHSFNYRYREISAAIDWIVKEGKDPSSPFYDIVDAEKIGAVGHSLGAYSLMAASGAIGIAYDSRIDAVVAMSGPGGKVFTSDSIKEIKIPTMLMYGEDEGDSKELGFEFQFDCLSSPKFILVIYGGNHTTFSENAFRQKKKDGEKERHNLIARYVGAFFDYYINGNEGAVEILKLQDPGLGKYDYKF
jgi:predicted dienelactone hydrolase